MNLHLILCAFGWHSWSGYCCRSSKAERDTQRECAHCGVMQTRITRGFKWENAK